MGKLFIVGLGPGGALDTTPRAEAALRESQVIIGYTKYIDLIRDRFPGKELIDSAMTTEVYRCHVAEGRVRMGQTVAMVCSGDAGVYGMAGLLLQICAPYPQMEIEIIPGVTAATAGAALLGAPLTNDFAAVSLSTALTSWETIERRLRAVAVGDFVICLYNPASRSRPDTLRRAAEVLLEILPPQTPCGLARNVSREGEESWLCLLGELPGQRADMFTTVLVGNSQTRIINGRLVTPRGYEKKGEL